MTADWQAGISWVMETGKLKDLFDIRSISSPVSVSNGRVRLEYYASAKTIDNDPKEPLRQQKVKALSVLVLLVTLSTANLYRRVGISE